MLLGDHAGNIAAAWNSTTAHDHCHDRFSAPHSANDIKSSLIFAHHGKVSVGNIA